MDTKRRTGNTFRPGTGLFPPGSTRTSQRVLEELLSGITLATVQGDRDTSSTVRNGWTVVFAGLWKVTESP